MKIYMTTLKGCNAEGEFWATHLGTYPDKHIAIARLIVVLGEQMAFYEEKEKEEGGKTEAFNGQDFATVEWDKDGLTFEKVTLSVKEVELGKDDYSLLTY